MVINLHMRILILFSLFLVGSIVSTSFSQNLVPNSNLETNTVRPCPGTTGGYPGGNYQICDGWFNAYNGGSTGNTSDYYCPGGGFSTLFVPTPVNPPSGDRCLGMASSLGEGVYTILTSTIPAGSTISYSLWVSPRNVLGAGVNDPTLPFGIYFYNGGIIPQTASPQVMTVTPQVVLPTSGMSVGNWTQLSGTYVTPSNVSHVAIAFFYPPGSSHTTGRYFAIDDIVITASTPCSAGTNTTPTTAICENGTKTLTATTSDGTWSIVSGGGSITGTTYTPPNVSANTSVTVRYTDGCGNTSDRTFTVNVLEPAVNTTPTTSMCEGGDKTLSGTPSGGTFTIISGGGSISGTTYTAPTVAGATNVTVRYTIPANGACPASTDDVIFTVDDNVPPSNTTNTDTICESATKALTGTPGGGTFTLLSGGGSITGTTYTPANINSPDVIEIEYAAPASGSCPAGEDTVSFVVMPLPEPIITSVNDTMCEGTTRLLTGTPAGGTWSVVSGAATITNDTLQASGAGTVVVQYTAFSAFGCSDSVTQNIETIASPTNPTGSASSDTICVGEQVTITGSGSGGGVTYNVYSTLTGSSWLGVTPYTVSPIVTSTYFIDADNGTCMNAGGRQPVTVVVNPVPSVTVTPDATICPTDMVTLVATGGGTYQWSTGSTNDSITVSPLVDTTYSVVVTNSFNCTSTDSVSITLLSSSITNAEDDSTTVRTNQDTTVDIAINDVGDPTTIVVLSEANHGTDTIINGVLTYRSDENYVGRDTIIYQICDGICTSLCDTAIVYLTVERDLLIPEFFSPNGDNMNDNFVILGLEKYPDNSIKIFNRWGNMVFQEAPFNGTWDAVSDGSLIGSSTLPTGTYYYILDLGDGSEPMAGYIVVRD